ncbi:MAG TPA: hypothetical protein IGS52_17740 [Oscillatoriaceae cyanobacterium M33_DOE_052]|uniref:Rhamnogalacturonase A/B/Epimerase-like pectate lyase domain-containing protein n=1 Tax=Planktothricoides sp. SpSt-374 TaxID=2282167 RepID=A0A7C3VLJ4_9CYAN|nr:hypothetical protein [Oscillatoriaceae cyanobacterium M33_DOE_052]
MSSLSRRQRKLWQLLSLAGFFSCVAVAIYALSLFLHNSPPPEQRANPVTAAISAAAPVAQFPGKNCGSASGGPTDNPVAAKYGNDYSWTDEIKWDCVYNITDFRKNTDIERFNAARDAAAANGGGVVYFPAGEYNFEDNIYLKNGVVLRGDNPNVADAKSSGYAPRSRLVFPKYEPRLTGNGTPNDTAFKKIFTENPSGDSNIGLVNLDINRAAIWIVGDAEGGKHRNLVVFGVRSNNVAEPDPQVPDVSFQDAWLRYSYRFATNIKLNGMENILVANNRLNDAVTDSYEQPGYKVKTADGKSVLTYGEGNKVPFSYTDHYGIVVNRSKSGGFALAATREVEPALFRRGIVIRDNWIYHTMRSAIHAAGDGLVIEGNQITDNPRKQAWAHPTGLKEPRGAATFENRAIDWSGSNVRIVGNQYQVYRHQIMSSHYLSTDGEGILIQECCGGTLVKGAEVANNQGNSYIGFYKVRDMENVKITGNRLLDNVSNSDLIFVVADTNNAPYGMKNVLIENNQVNGSILVKGTAGGSGNVVRNNRGNNSGAIMVSCHVNVSGNTGFAVPPCQ